MLRVKAELIREKNSEMETLMKENNEALQQKSDQYNQLSKDLMCVKDNLREVEEACNVARDQKNKLDLSLGDVVRSQEQTHQRMEGLQMKSEDLLLHAKQIIRSKENDFSVCEFLLPLLIEPLLVIYEVTVYDGMALMLCGVTKVYVILNNKSIGEIVEC